MSELGKIIASPVRLINLPSRVVEKLVDPESENGDDDNILSAPLETVAQCIEDIFD